MSEHAPRGARAAEPLPLCVACKGKRDLFLCERCGRERYCSAACQSAAAAAHAPLCAALSAGNVLAVYLPATQSGGLPLMRDLTLPAGHLSLAGALPSPVLHRAGIALMVSDAPLPAQLPRTPFPDCQFATFAMVGPSGYAPARWQTKVGDRLVFRADGLPLTQARRPASSAPRTAAAVGAPAAAPQPRLG